MRHPIAGMLSALPGMLLLLELLLLPKRNNASRSSTSGRSSSLNARSGGSSSSTIKGKAHSIPANFSSSVEQGRGKHP